MSLMVCLAPRDTLDKSEVGGHLWVYLNWALGLLGIGCRVIWLDEADPKTPPDQVQAMIADLKCRLEPYGLAQSVGLCSLRDWPLSQAAVDGCLDFDAAADADLLLNFRCHMLPEVVSRFRRSAFVDIDPGLFQIWASRGQVSLARHDAYFTIGETAGQPGALFPDLGLQWQYTPPCVALPWWPPRLTAEAAAFTTVAHWYAGGWTEDVVYPDDKRSAFISYLDLPQYAARPLELALDLQEDDDDWKLLQERGWRLRHALGVTATPWGYQRYIQNSFGEFSCAKPAYVRLQSGWISDRTICYLASGKPAVVQHTGPSRFLPDAAGLFRFRDFEEAVRGLETVGADYERHSRLARALAEEHFDARKVVARVLERALA